MQWHTECGVADSTVTMQFAKENCIINEQLSKLPGNDRLTVIVLLDYCESVTVHCAAHNKQASHTTIKSQCTLTTTQT